MRIQANSYLGRSVIFKVLGGVVLLLNTFGSLAGASDGPAVSAANTPSAKTQDPFASRVLEFFEKAGVKRDSLGISISDLQKGTPIVEINESQARSPASAAKLLTAYVALKRLGVDYHFETQILRSQNWDRSGRLKGDLEIRGSGDPSLTTRDLYTLALQLKSKGLKKIDGNIVLNDTVFDSDERDEAKIPSDSTRPFNAPISGLNLNSNIFRVGLSPLHESGAETTFAVEPKNQFIQIKNSVQVGGQGQSSGVSQRRLTANSLGEVYELSGKISRTSSGSPAFLEINLKSPSDYLGSVFLEVLKDVGIAVKNKNPFTRASSGRGELVASSRSASLVTLVAEMNKSSSNVFADSLVKTLGHEVYGEGGRIERGLQIINEEATRLGINSSGFKFVSGSGLTHFNRMSPLHFTRLFSEAFKDFDVFPEWLSSLSIAGIDGTLEKKMHANPAFGRLRGKTGTIDGVSSLVGLVKTRSGRLLSFAAIINVDGGAAPRGRAWHDDFGRLLVNYESDSPVSASENVGQ